MWLEANKTNNDTKVIAGYLMNTVINARGCPLRTRFDFATENGHMTEMQFLHFSDNQVQTACVTFGPGTVNGQIERWWQILRIFTPY